MAISIVTSRAISSNTGRQFGIANSERKRPRDLITLVNERVGKQIARRGQTAHVRLEFSRDALNQSHLRYADLLAACVLEISDLSARQTRIDIRIGESAIVVTGSNPILMPQTELCPDAVVLDQAEAAGLPVRLAWEQCMGPQLMIELTPGGFTLNRAFRLANDRSRTSAR